LPVSFPVQIIYRIVSYRRSVFKSKIKLTVRRRHRLNRYLVD